MQRHWFDYQPPSFALKRPEGKNYEDEVLETCKNLAPRLDYTYLMDQGVMTLEHPSFTTEQFQTLCRDMQRQGGVNKLYFISTSLTVGHMERLAQFLAENRGVLRTLSFEQCGLTSAHLTPLAPFLETSTTVRRLSFPQNEIDGPGVLKAVVLPIFNNKDHQIRQLDMRNNKVDDKGGEYLRLLAYANEGKMRIATEGNQIRDTALLEKLQPFDVPKTQHHLSTVSSRAALAPVVS